MDRELYLLGLEYKAGAARLKTRMEELDEACKTASAQERMDYSERAKILYDEYLDAKGTGSYLIENYGPEQEEQKEAAG